MSTVGQKGDDGEVSGGWVRGRPRLGWMDFVKEAEGDRRITVEAASQCAKDRKDWRVLGHMYFTRPFLLGTVFFRTALPCSGDYYLERGGMPLPDADGINCKKGATTEYQGSDVKYMG